MTRSAFGAPARVPVLMVAALVALLAAAPFLDKAVQQDDWAYIATAPGLIAGPGEWLEQTTIYQGEEITAAQGVLHGPVWLTLLALGLEWGDGGVFLPHVFMALLLAVLAVGATSFAARFGAPPLPTALALALSPGILVMAGSVMTDLPMVALFTAAMALFVRGVDRESALDLALAGAVGLAASLTRYHGTAILGLFAVGPWLLGGLRPVRFASFVPAAIVLAGLVVFGIVTAGDWERAVEMLGDVPVIDYTGCLLSAVCALGACAIGWVLVHGLAPDAWGRALAADRSRLVVWALGLAAGAALVVVADGHPGVARPTGPSLWLERVAILGGSVSLVAALSVLLRLVPAAVNGERRDAWRARFGLEALVALWLLGYTFAAWTTVPFGATRYALPAMPPLFLFAGRFAQRFLADPVRPWIAATLCAAAGLGAAFADLRYAEVQRDFGERVVRERDENTPGSPFVGGTPWIWGELGFRYYLEHGLADGRVLPSDSDEPREGDLVLKSSICTATPDDGLTGLYAIDPRLYQRLRHTWLEEVTDDYPIRIHNAEAGAGFYHVAAGFLPYAFSDAPHDRHQVWRVEAPNPFLRRALAGDATLDDPERIKVARFRVHPEETMRLAITIVAEGGVTFDDVEVPAAGSAVEVLVGESWRVWTEEAPGRGVRARVLANGEVVGELEVQSRVNEADRRWVPLRAELPFPAGERVRLRLEVEALPDDGGEPGRVFTGFAEPRIVSPDGL